MDALSRPVSYFPLLIVLLNLLGCTPLVPLTENLHPKYPPTTAEYREKIMHDRWAGKTYNELVEHLGKPTLVMGIPGGGWPTSSAIHYGIRDLISGCIDPGAPALSSDRRTGAGRSLAVHGRMPGSRTRPTLSWQWRYSPRWHHSQRMQGR